MDDILNSRPSEVLNEYLTYAGYDRTGKTDRGTLCEMLAWYDFYDPETDDFRGRFVSLGVGQEPDAAIQDGYMNAIRMYEDDYRHGRTETCRKLSALVVVFRAEGRVVNNSERVAEPNAENAPFLQAAGWGMCQTRIIQVLTVDGFATHSIVFPPEGVDAEPLVDTAELFTGFGPLMMDEPEVTGKMGAIPFITPTLSMVLGILLLLGLALEDGLPPTVQNLARVASRYRTDDGDTMGDEVMNLLERFADQLDINPTEGAEGLGETLRRLMEDGD